MMSAEGATRPRSAGAKPTCGTLWYGWPSAAGGAGHTADRSSLGVYRAGGYSGGVARGEGAELGRETAQPGIVMKRCLGVKVAS